MAKKSGVGISSKPPQANKNKGKKGKKEAKKKYGEFATPGYAGLNDAQAAIINQTNQSDYDLGSYARGQLPGIQDAFSQPFDYGSLPTSPWSQGQTLKDMETEYYDRALANYDRSMSDQYKQQDIDFEQQMYSRGVPPGSELYNKLKAETQKTRDVARQNAMDNAYFNSSQNANTWNQIGSENFQNAYAFENDRRNRPLAEYGAIMGAQSGLPMAAFSGSQAYGLQQNDIANQRWMMKNTPRGGGSSGGGGSLPLYAQYGFSTPQEMDAYRTAQQRDQFLWTQQNTPRPPSGPSYGSQLGGGILGSLATGWALGGFSNPFG